jgi:hypothetical protein
MNFLGIECAIRFGNYAQGGTAVWLIDDETGEPVTNVTSWIPGLAPDEIAIKNYSENEGMLNAFLATGLINPPHRHIHSGFVSFPICRLKGVLA